MDVESDRRGVEQQSYRLRLTRLAQRPGAGKAVWDSGDVRSPESANVEYTGPALEPATAYTWEVDVGTDAGSARASSTFRTGLYDESDWAGSAMDRQRANRSRRTTR